MVTPMKSLAEQIVAQDAGYMEFDLTSDMGYGQWLGMFMELGASSRRFNGYMIQPQNQEVQVSLTTVELHLFTRGIYVAPPLEEEDYFYSLLRPQLRLGRAYFHTPGKMVELKGYQPSADELLALDVWVENDETMMQTVYSFFFEARIATDRGYRVIDRVTDEQWAELSNQLSSRGMIH